MSEDLNPQQLAERTAQIMGGRDRASRFLGIEMLEIGPAYCVMALTVSVIGGAASGMVNVARQTFFQRAVPDRIRSRVFSVAEVVATASFILGLGTAGPVIELVGVRVAYVLAGIVFVLGALVLLPVLRHRGEGILADERLPPT